MNSKQRNVPAPILAFVLLSALGLAACGRAEGSSDKPSPSASTAVVTPAVATPDVYVTIPGTQIEIAAPGDWVRKSKPGGWSVMIAPDKKAAFAFVTFAKGQDPTPRIGEIAVAVEASGIGWESPRKVQLGPDDMPATLAKGSCQYASGPGRIVYALVDPGGDKQLLAVYVANDTATAEARKDAAQAFKSLRKKR